MDFAIKYLSDPVCPVFGPVRSRVCPFSYMLYILLQKDFHYSVFSCICQELILHGLQIAAFNVTVHASCNESPTVQWFRRRTKLRRFLLCSFLSYITLKDLLQVSVS